MTARYFLPVRFAEQCVCCGDHLGGLRLDGMYFDARRGRAVSPGPLTSARARQVLARTELASNALA